MDLFDKKRRSEIMRRIKSKDTVPEIVVRKIIHGLGLRFRLQDRLLPGRPDIVLKRWKTVVFVHGCFWHCHNCRKGRRKPKSNIDYWHPKLERNQMRDMQNRRKLKKLGWRPITVWACETANLPKLTRRMGRLFPRLSVTP